MVNRRQRPNSEIAGAVGVGTKSEAALQRHVLEILSIICEAVSPELVRECLERAGIRVKPQRYRDALGRLVEGRQLEYIDDKIRCRAQFREANTRAAVAGKRFDGFARAVKQVLPVARSWNRTAHYRNRDQALREVRIAFYRQDARALQQALWEMDHQFPPDGTADPPLISIGARPLDVAWMTTLPAPLQAVLAGEILSWSALRLEPCDGLLAALTEGRVHAPGPVRVFQADVLLLQGRRQEAVRVLEGMEGPPRLVRLGWMAFLEGDNDEALAFFEAGLHDLRRESASTDVYYRTYGGLFHMLALLKDGSAESIVRLETCIDMGSREPLWRPVCKRLHELVCHMHGRPYDSDSACQPPAGETPAALAFLEHACMFWRDRESVDVEAVERLHQRAERGGYAWVAGETAALLAALRVPQHQHYATLAQEMRERTGSTGLIGVVTLSEPWERSLAALAKLTEEPAQAAAASETRLVWLLSLPDTPDGDASLRPVEQRRTARGGWTKGRAMPLKRLYTMAERPECMTEQDHRVCAALKATPERWNPERIQYDFHLEDALIELVGHPAIFRDEDPRQRLDLVRGEPELIIREDQGELHLTLRPDANSDRRVILVRETPTRIRLVCMEKIHRRVAEILGPGLHAPLAARERIREVIAPLAGSLSIQSDIGSMEEGATVVEADATIHVHLLPAGEGLSVEFLVQPLGSAGPTYVPARGGTTVVADVKGRRLEAKRDFLEERNRAGAVMESCPTLLEIPHVNWAWSVEEPGFCLELLAELRDLDNTVRVEWPEGKVLSVSRTLHMDDLAVEIRRQRDWFAVSGNLRVNEELTISLAELVRLAAQASGRFIAMGEGHFLALTEEFKRRLEDFSFLGEVRRDEIRCHLLAAPTLDAMTQDADQVEADPSWHMHLRSLDQAADLVAEIPSTLQAELRDYQIEGFRWISRLAVWGAGACLADDMGLGKTVQALAAILSRAEEGPSLVVAPTSVCLNWRDEALRFAPTLRIVIFGQGDRKEQVEGLGAFDLLVCSYGLMQTSRQLLESVEWRTIVLDEAQAIKNPRAKRSQAAFRLPGRLRIVTTGTPIENNLAELWSLFRFINPGLLGSRQSFNERFALPIERDGDAAVRHRLKRLISPFVLRRTKSQVLEELPARTEITQHITLSEKERAFYEALRRESLQRIHERSDGPGARRMQILAEITRLRQACCNPRLILPSCDIGSSKLEAFDEILDELLASRHKALVFSQFVTHLTLVREHVIRKGISHQYLDGSTPQKERAERVAAFQRGEGDVFLISLRAGGTGLNLTAADYVIHMDPWWNPAVEDQASDRAHRIGQFRPVTIYRLVATDTIEEKIVELHHHKRGLAESLLSGSNVPSAVSADELLRLMSEE